MGVVSVIGEELVTVRVETRGVGVWWVVTAACPVIIVADSVVSVD